MRAYPITELSHVAEVRRGAVRQAQSLGFDATEQGRVAIVVTELATNLIKHAGQGTILVGDRLASDVGSAIDCIALDKGPAMADVGRCLADGYSTAGSQGTGLGAVLRQSTLTDIHSQPGVGTAIMARIAPGVMPFTKPGAILKLYEPRETDIIWGGVNVPYPGEEVCGDNWSVMAQADDVICLVADGLGHGTLAAEASRVAVDLFEKNATRQPAEILDILHKGMRQTRGAAVSVIGIDRPGKVLRVAGIGNIAGTLITASATRRLLSHNGTVGQTARKIQEISYPLDGPFTLFMMSDGIATSWTIERYIGLMEHHPLTIAAVLYRDHGRGTDDATVVVVRH